MKVCSIIGGRFSLQNSPWMRYLIIYKCADIGNSYRKLWQNIGSCIFSITSKFIMSETNSLSYENSNHGIDKNLLFSSLKCHKQHPHTIMDLNKEGVDDIRNFSGSERQVLEEMPKKMNGVGHVVHTTMARSLILDLVEQSSMVKIKSL